MILITLFSAFTTFLISSVILYSVRKAVRSKVYFSKEYVAKINKMTSQINKNNTDIQKDIEKYRQYPSDFILRKIHSDNSWPQTWHLDENQQPKLIDMLAVISSSTAPSQR